jgi:hypothetical protein
MVNELEYCAFVYYFYLLDEPTWQAIDGLRHFETIQFLVFSFRQSAGVDSQPES